MAREDRQELEATIDELKNQITELTTKLESGALALKSFSDVCTFRAICNWRSSSSQSAVHT